MKVRQNLDTWRTIFRNIAEAGDEVIVMYVDGEWILTNEDDANPELFEDGYQTGQEAYERLDYIEDMLL